MRTPTIHPIPQRVIERVFDRADVRGPDDCWEWKLSRSPRGYGQIGWKVAGTTLNAGTTAHRVAWVATHGVIPGGLVVDHICRNRGRVNPTHLRLLTNSENARLNRQRLQTHCKRGHEFTPKNTRINRKGHRFCRACSRLSDAGRRPRGCKS